MIEGIAFDLVRWKEHELRESISLSVTEMLENGAVPLYVRQYNYVLIVQIRLFVDTYKTLWWDIKHYDWNICLVSVPLKQSIRNVMDMTVFPYIVHLQRTPRFFLIQLHPVTFPVTYPKCYLHGGLNSKSILYKERSHSTRFISSEKRNIKRLRNFRSESNLKWI